MRSHALSCQRAVHGASSGGRAAAAPRPRFTGGQVVCVRSELRDADGRLLVPAGARGEIAEELDTAPGWWLVTYDATAQCWPTPGELLRPGHLRLAGRLDKQALLQVVRLLMHAMHEGWGARDPEEAEQNVHDVMAYVMGCGKTPRAVYELLSDRPARCRCSDSGVCTRCNGRGGRCRACKGTRICARCPRLAQRDAVATTVRAGTVA